MADSHALCFESPPLRGQDRFLCKSPPKDSPISPTESLKGIQMCLSAGSHRFRGIPHKSTALSQALLLLTQVAPHGVRVAIEIHALHPRTPILSLLARKLPNDDVVELPLTLFTAEVTR